MITELNPDIKPNEIDKPVNERKFTFTLMEAKFPGFNEKQVQYSGMQSSCYIKRFTYDQPFQEYEIDKFLLDLFHQNPHIKVQLLLIVAVLKGTGEIRKCLDEYYDSFLIGDELRKCLLMPEFKLYDTFSEKDRKEFIFHVFKAVCLGGRLCQYEDVLEPYLHATRHIYKDLITVAKSETGKLKVASLMSNSPWSYRISQKSRPKPSVKQMVLSNQASIESLIRQAKPLTTSSQKNRQSATSRPTTVGDLKFHTSDSKWKSDYQNKRSIHTSKTIETTDERQSRVRFSEPDYDNKKDSSSAKPVYLNEANLKKHTEYMRMIQPLSVIERVAQWAQAIPMVLEDPDTPLSYPPQSKSCISKRKNLGESQSVPSLHSNDKDEKESQYRQKSLPLLGEMQLTANRVQSPLFVTSFNSKQRAQEMKRKDQLPVTEPIKFANIDNHNERGRLICCLKVEIKSGVYKMLPIHKILAIFSILNESITQRKIWISRIGFGVVSLIICIAIILQMFYQALDVPPPLSKLIQYSILFFCAITAAYDNGQVIYLAHLIFITKRNRNRVEDKLKKVIMISFTVVIIDWLGVILYGYNIIAQPKQTLYLLTQCVIGIHTSMMAFVLTRLKELTFGGRTVKKKVAETTVILEIFSILNEKITKSKINVMKFAVGIYTGIICAAVMIQAYYGFGNDPVAFGWFIQFGILVLALFAAFYDNAQCIYLAFLIFNSKRNKQEIETRVVSTVMLNISILLLDWIGIGIYTYNILTDPPESLYLATQCFVGIHLSSMALVLASLKELTFFGCSVEKKSEKILQKYSILNENITRKKIQIAKVIFVFYAVFCSIGLVLQTPATNIDDVSPAIQLYAEFGMLALVVPSVIYDNLQALYLAKLVFDFRSSKNPNEIVYKTFLKAINLNLIVVLMDWIGIGIYGYNIIYCPAESLYLVSQSVVCMHSTALVTVFLQLKKLVFVGTKLDKTVV
ncbi:hypothetical protein HDV06_003959 [Boothiomyces sp. JEL0866]|nr:hypothetical protein HDV06_003959 [Boothiomyces sp. JEL0866]